MTGYDCIIQHRRVLIKDVREPASSYYAGFTRRLAKCNAAGAQLALVLIISHTIITAQMLYTGGKRSNSVEFQVLGMPTTTAICTARHSHPDGLRKKTHFITGSNVAICTQF